MYRVSVAILHCAEYNPEKLKAHWGKPKSPEEFLHWNLEYGITMCIQHLLTSETYHWNKLKNSCHRYPRERSKKKPPVKLRKILDGLMNSSVSEQTENERIVELRTGIRDVIIYLRKIKNDDNYLNSTALQNVHEYLESLLEMKVSPIKTNNPEECL